MYNRLPVSLCNNLSIHMRFYKFTSHIFKNNILRHQCMSFPPISDFCLAIYTLMLYRLIKIQLIKKHKITIIYIFCHLIEKQYLKAILWFSRTLGSFEFDRTQNTSPFCIFEKPEVPF